MSHSCGQQMRKAIADFLATEKGRTVVAEFNGSNHLELAQRHGVLLSFIHFALIHARREAMKQALRQALDTAPEDIEVLRLDRSEFLSVIEAVAQVAQTATAEDRLDRFVIALAILPPAPESAPRPNNPADAQVDPIKNRPDTPDRSDIARPRLTPECCHE